ncbi:MAG: DOMON-like domain-containing protein [Dechloromonas sp.]|nr:DOMON-like domain-containing protein [Dechloromonas sp.]
MVPTQHALHCHPASACASVLTVEVSASLAGVDGLAVCYRLRGDLAAIRIPDPASLSASDGLWQHTCLEAFVAAVDSPEYREFNFSPSGQWASYRFTAYRTRDFRFIPPAAPHIACQQCTDGFRLDAVIAPELLPAGAILNIGLTAVIEARDSSKSYWALTHCAAQPDFHLRQSFSLTLQRPTP